MKKLTKMGIDALRETLPVLSREEQSSYMGMWTGDCFWRCVAFIDSGNYSENGVREYAWDYFTELCGSDSAAYQRLQVTAWIGMSSASGYLSQNSHLRMTGMSIAGVDPIVFEDYTGYNSHVHHPMPDGSWSSGSGHYIVIMPGVYSDGSRLAFDPTYDVHFRISSEEYNNYVSASLV